MSQSNPFNSIEGYSFTPRTRFAKNETENTSPGNDDISMAVAITSSLVPFCEILSVNPAFERITGYTQAEVVGKDLTMLQKGDFDQPDIPHLFASLQAHKPVTVRIRSYRKNGEMFWNEMTILPMYQPDGEVAQFLGIIRDVTKERETETALRTNQERLSVITEMASDYAYFHSVDEHGNVARQWITDTLENVLGYTPEEIVGNDIDRIMHPDDVAKRKNDLARVMLGESVIGDYRIFTKQGDMRWIRLHRRPVWDESQERVVAYYGAGKDITLEKEASAHQVALARQEERMSLLNEFIGNLAHDMKTPLTTMSMFLRLLKKSENETDKQYNHDMIASQIDMLKVMIDDVLTFSRLEGEVVLIKDHINLDDMLGNLIETLRVNALGRTLVLEANADLPTVIVGQKDEIYRAFTNLIENAIRYTPSEGHIRVRLNRNANEAIIEIADTGMGIGEDDLPHIFDRFFRSERVRQARISGTGLGLAIVKRVVERHNGRISVQSTLGEGTTFRVLFPLL
jgi:PAS domain S-box-containing protein